MIEFLKQLLDWVYRQNCYFCRKTCSSGLICADCYDKIEILPAAPIKFAGSTPVYTVSTYIDNTRKMIRAVKYHQKKELAPVMAKLIYDQLQKIPENRNFEIVPVPLYKTRQKQRGFNHMELVGAELSRITGYNLNTSIIERIKDTKPQFKLSRKERIENLHNAFRVKPENYDGKSILLIDDICTTGTTFEEIIREFNKHGITDITAFVLAVPCL